MLIVQAYVVAPAGPLAVFPVEFEHTDAEVVTTGDEGGGLIGTLTVSLAEQPAPFVADTESVTFPEGPAV